MTAHERGTKGNWYRRCSQALILRVRSADLVFGKDAKFRPFGGVIARALLGDDEKFGGERGLIDFVRTKKKPVKKQAGGK